VYRAVIPVQDKVEAIWPTVTEENLFEVTDYKSYNEEFLKLFGFGIDRVDYTNEVETEVDFNLI